MWFRRDLRLADHPALAAAFSNGEVLPLFVIDPAFERAGRPRQQFLAGAVRSLDDEMGGALTVRHGDPVDVVPELAAAIGADEVFVSRDYSPYGRGRDRLVSEALRAAGRHLHGVDSNYAVAPGSILKADGTPYSVFTPFAKRWRQHGWSAPLDAPAQPNWTESVAPADTALLAVSDSYGEDEAHQRWETFRDGPLDVYAAMRDVPSVDGTSRLSAHLKFGTIHPRQLFADLDQTRPDHFAFANELAWREFYADVLFHHPDSAYTNLDRRFDQMPLDTDAAAHERFGRWCAGQTGFPIVDAGMRQLVTTGWMHNRVRMIVASFLVKDLHLPWWWGARHFMAHLVDGDLASNSHGWQWAAGSGTDAAPYFRVFNPTTQAERYDADGAYVAEFVPEFGTARYPAPMVDHKAERLEALLRYESVRGSR